MFAFFFLAYGVEKKLGTKTMLLFEYLYEKIYYFYEDILGKEESPRIKSYVVTLFFVIFFANIFSVIFDFIAPIFGQKENGDFLLANIIVFPT